MAVLVQFHPLYNGTFMIYNEGPMDWKNVLVATSFDCVKVLFCIFDYYYQGWENRLLYQGLHYKEVRLIKVPLWHFSRVNIQVLYFLFLGSTFAKR